MASRTKNISIYRISFSYFSYKFYNGPTNIMSFTENARGVKNKKYIDIPHFIFLL